MTTWKLKHFCLDGRFILGLWDGADNCIVPIGSGFAVIKEGANVEMEVDETFPDLRWAKRYVESGRLTALRVADEMADL